MPGSKFQWMLAAIVPVALLAQFGMEKGATQEQAFMPGESSHGHYQIELKCSICHTPDMGVKQDACIDCHQAEMDRVDDSHPTSKFMDPRNADRVALLNARKCVTCHQEHQPEKTGEMAVTLPTDYCYFCHKDLATDLPDHADLPFNSCSTTGCHNFHDNSALYEDFLAKHLDDPALKPECALPVRDHYASWPKDRQRRSIALSERDAPSSVPYSQDLAYAWSASSHAAAGVNCIDCHATDGAAETWTDHPGVSACRTCHDYESDTFLQSRHGMRLAQDMSPMTPAMARLPMKASAAHEQMNCVACHDAHSFETRAAAVDACLRCHDDDHSRAYKQSKHYQLWLAELDGSAPANTGVSCATCHLPRVEVNAAGVVSTRVLHNQNDTLRPVEKMIRPVCLECHGLGFSIDAQADESLLRRNYVGQPADHVKSIDMVKEKLRRIEAERDAAKPVH